MCAGMMDLANLPRVVFAQADPSQRSISHLLHELHPDSSPRPSQIDLDLARELDREFAATQLSITDFLRTPEAHMMFTEAGRRLRGFECRFPENEPFLDQARRFLDSPPAAVEPAEGEHR